MVNGRRSRKRGAKSGQGAAPVAPSCNPIDKLLSATAVEFGRPIEDDSGTADVEDTSMEHGAQDQSQDDVLPLANSDKPNEGAGKQRRKRVPSFRFHSKTLYFTFPQCDTPKTVALDNIVAEWGPNVEFAVVSRELHEDGFPHLHGLVKFVSKVNYKDCTFANFIGGKQGNYQSCRSIANTYRYIVKNGDFVTHGSLPVCVRPKKVSIGDSVISAMKEGATMSDIRHRFPVYYMIHRAKLAVMYNEMRAEAEFAPKEKFPGFVVPNVLVDSIGHAIFSWLNKNFLEPRTHKQPQLWLWGPPGVGKTPICMEMEKYFRPFHLNKTSKFYDGYSDDTCDFVVIDEYKAQKCITELNQFLEGVTMNLEIKGAFVVKTKSSGNKPVIILSNFSPRECYKNTTEAAIAPLLARITEVYIPEEYKIYEHMKLASSVESILFDEAPPMERLALADYPEDSDETESDSGEMSDDSINGGNRPSVPMQIEELPCISCGMRESKCICRKK